VYGLVLHFPKTNIYMGDSSFDTCINRVKTLLGKATVSIDVFDFDGKKLKTLLARKSQPDIYIDQQEIVVCLLTYSIPEMLPINKKLSFKIHANDFNQTFFAQIGTAMIEIKVVSIE
jgi:hypothetical protein